LEIAHAGQTVACRCGKTQQAPTLLKMKSLPGAEAAASELHTAGPLHLRSFFAILGVIVLVPSLGFLVWALLTHPRPADVSKKQVWFTYGNNRVAQDSIPLERYEHDILNASSDAVDHTPPFQVYLFFRTLKNGPVLSYNFQENYQMLKDAYRIRVSAAAICFGLGLLSLVASLFMSRQTKTVGVRRGAEWK